MLSRTTIKRHAHLVDTMAEAQGFDLEEEILRGHLSIPDLDDAVLRCTGCTQPCACEAWLAALSVPASEPPAYCRNQELFDGLRHGQ